MENMTEKFAEFCAEIRYENLSSDVIKRTKLLILDTVGIIIRARHDAESTASLVAAIDRLEMSNGSCQVFSDKNSYSPSAAALLNGTLAHSLDFDDTHAEASLHSSAPILSAALAAAQMNKSSGQELITACVAGYEIQIRLGLAGGSSAHYKKGFHPTATCGVFGAVASAGYLMGLTKDQFVSAFGIALSQSAGSMQFLTDGAWTKRSHVGQAAQNGLNCATMAAEGFQGPSQASSEMPAEIVRDGEGNYFYTSITIPPGAETMYLSGSGARPKADDTWGDMKQQTIDTFERFKSTLESNGWSMRDIVQVRAFALAGEDGLDFSGFNEGYSEFFGTTGNPNKPVRSFVEVKDLVVDGWLVEIEVRAARVAE